MRLGVWRCCAAVALLAVVAASALRPQTESTRKIGRRISKESSSEKSDDTQSNQYGTVEFTSLRPRGSRRREETHTVRARTRGEVVRHESSTTESSDRNERSRKMYSRTRNKPRDELENNSTVTVHNSRRQRPTIRRSTTAVPETSSPIIDESKIEVVNSNLDEITKITFNPSTQFSRRTSGRITPFAQTTERIPSKRRLRVNTRISMTNSETDLASSGTTNSITMTDKEPTTARSNERNQRKLRYKSRLSETETNLTENGPEAAPEVTKSSQINENPPSQAELSSLTPIIVVAEPERSTESGKPSTTVRITKVVRRPASTRGIPNFRPSISLVKPKLSEEINEDDNYPASFKALIQAKNASTQTSSPPRESLSVIASQKVYNTYTSTQQSTNTGSEKLQNSTRLRNKPTYEDKSNQIRVTTEDNKVEVTPTEANEIKPSEENLSESDNKTTKRPEYKPRVNYSRRKASIASSSPSTTKIPGEVSNKPVYKFNRKLKITTTSAPVSQNIKTNQLNTNNLLKKSLPRSSYYSRFKSSTRHDISTEPTSTVAASHESSEKPTLRQARPVYHPRYRGPKTNETLNKKRVGEINNVEKNKLEILEKPATYKTVTLITSNDNMAEVKQENRDEPELFVISVNTKSPENMPEEQLPETVKKSETETMQFVLTTPMYHSSYKDLNKPEVEISTEEIKIYSTPTIRNLQTRKFERRKKEREDVESSTAKPLNPNLNKFVENNKLGTMSSNGITPEYEKPKNRFSSKYRASYLDKPVYKPTVPTVTPSTAWLKFFVTDRELLRAQEPYWFDGELLNNASTEPMDVSLFTASPVTHDPTIQLVEGEESQLGPDLNSISFTQTRSTLSSADLRLSESVKSSLIMNVEATNHSPSVTVSIFDALAEILTSTPRSLRLSSTTEFQKNIITDAKQTANGVSNQIMNVNKDLPTLDMFLSKSADITASTQTARVTDQTSQNVINSATFVNDVTPSSIADISTQAFPTPTPTPLSPRKPFAVKILYSNTELPTDKVTTAPETTTLPSTDQTTMVYNTVSDLILYNNNLVSSELTSMLSNNIKNILLSMDDNTKSKFSVDNMAKLLKTLIPRALGGKSFGSDDLDFVPMTTPYSLEEIRDTEVEIDFGKETSNSTEISDLLENVMSENVNTEKTTTVEILPTVNNSQLNTDFTSTAVSETNTQITIDNSMLTTTVNEFFTSTVTSLSSTTELPVTLVQDAVTVDLENNTSATFDVTVDNTNKDTPVPFFTNFMKSDFGSINEDRDENQTLLKSVPLTSIPENPRLSSPTLIPSESNVQKTGNVSPVQLWILSKKARVLKMIEDLLKQHNNELATYPPLTISQTNPLPFSQRLTEILNNFNPTTTDANDININIETRMSNPDPNPSTLQIELPSISEDLGTTTKKTDDEGLSTTPENVAKFSTQGGSNDKNMATTAMTDVENKTVDISERDQSEETTMATTTSFEDYTIETMLETTTEYEIKTTTNVPEESTTPMANNNTASVDSTTIISILPPSPPKKDYVIFGILPNNTVVRKNPNEDILESLTESTPYIVYGVLPNNTVIRKFPNGTRVPRILQKIDVLPISPWSLRNPYSPIHNNPAIVRPQSNPIRVSTNVETSSDISNNGTEILTTDTVNNQQLMISSSALNVTESSTLGVLTTTNRPPADKSTASHVLRLRTSTMLPSIEEILLNSISSAARQEMIISSMTSSTHEPRILTLDIDPETKEIRTEKPNDGNGSAIFKFIPIDTVTVPTQNSNVQKLATKSSTTTIGTETTPTSFTEANTQTPQIINYFGERNEITTSQTYDSIEVFTTTPAQTTITTAEITTTPEPSTTTTELSTTTSITEPTTTSTSTETTTTTTAPTITTTAATTTTEQTTITDQVTTPTTTPAPTTTTTEATTTTSQPTTRAIPTTTQSTTLSPVQNIEDDEKQFQQDAELLKVLLQATGRDPKSISIFNDKIKVPTNEVNTLITPKSKDVQQNLNDVQLLQTLLNAGNNSPSTSISNIRGDIKNIATTTLSPSTTSSIEDDIKQFEEDSKLLQALLQATGQKNINLPALNSINPSTFLSSKPDPETTTQKQTTTLNNKYSIENDAQFLQALLQAQDSKNSLPPIITGKTSNVRLSNTMTTQQYPVFTLTTTQNPVLSTTYFKAQSPLTTTLQPRTEGNSFSSTNDPKRRPSTAFDGDSSAIRNNVRGTFPTARRMPSSRFTTETPSTSTFSVEEDIQFLNNLKSVLNTEANADPETVLANRVIALAVEKSLNEIQNKQSTESIRGVPVTFRMPTTTMTTTTTTPKPPTTLPPSIEADIKQFEEDSKLLQALLKATGQDASKFNIPTITNGPTNVRVTTNNISPNVNSDLNLLSNLLASPSPLNEPFDALTKNPSPVIITRQKAEPIPRTTTPSTRPYGAKITVNGLKNNQDEAYLQTLINLQETPVPTTQRTKATVSGQSPDVALRLLSRNKATGMVSEATQMPMSLSTEYGKSNDALLAALLKEQGFGPTTASSLDEQIRLAALLNQVVVTPKARTTTPPPPPPPPRRPVLDGLAWLWQQWRETSPAQPRPDRRPAPVPLPAMSSSASTSNRVNWFGSGPFTGHSEQRPTSNRVPLEPPRAPETAGRGQLVSAAINVTRAFSQFLGAAIQGAAQTVQNVIRAGQRATADAYSGGSG